MENVLSFSVSRGARVLSVCALIVTLSPGSAGARQTAPEPPGYARPHAPGIGPAEPDPLANVNGTKLEHMREDDRRKHLLADTAKLLQLTTELKSEVDKTSKDELSIDVVRKAAEIEKLAHDVKERMKS